MPWCCATATRTTTPATVSERLYVAQDANWNVTARINSSGAAVERIVYDPYGKPTFMDSAGADRMPNASSFDWVYLHQGLRLDSIVDLYDNRARVYSATLMRFLQNDPIGFAARDGNTYRYEASHPISRLDPVGEKVLVCHGKTPINQINNVVIGPPRYHITIWAWCETTKKGYQIDGGGSGNDGVLGKTNANVHKSIRDVTNDIWEWLNSERKNGNQTCFEVKTGKENCEDELKALLEVYRQMEQIALYFAVSGPNSNTFAHQILINAGFALSPADDQTVRILAPGWSYNGDMKYGGLFFDQNGIPLFQQSNIHYGLFLHYYRKNFFGGAGNNWQPPPYPPPLPGCRP